MFTADGFVFLGSHCPVFFPAQLLLPHFLVFQKTGPVFGSALLVRIEARRGFWTMKILHLEAWFGRALDLGCCTFSGCPSISSTYHPQLASFLASCRRRASLTVCVLSMQRGYLVKAPSAIVMTGTGSRDPPTCQGGPCLPRLVRVLLDLSGQSLFFQAREARQDHPGPASCACACKPPQHPLYQGTSLIRNNPLP